MARHNHPWRQWWQIVIVAKSWADRRDNNATQLVQQYCISTSKLPKSNCLLIRKFTSKQIEATLETDHTAQWHCTGCDFKSESWESRGKKPLLQRPQWWLTLIVLISQPPTEIPLPYFWCSIGGRVKIPFLDLCKNTLASNCFIWATFEWKNLPKSKSYYVRLEPGPQMILCILGGQFYAQSVSCFRVELWSLQLRPSHLMPPVALRGSWAATIVKWLLLHKKVLKSTKQNQQNTGRPKKNCA